MFEETGIGIKNPLWFVGVVENRNDPRKEGRVQVRAFGVHGTNREVATVDLPWAICIAGNYDPNYPIPPLNSWVFGFFLDGRDAQQPMILGLIPTQMTSLIDPETNGWGTIPTENVRLDSQGSRATDFGQPQNSRKARGEELDKTDILLQEVSRVSANLDSVEEGFLLEEPAPGAAPVYPYNRVTETAGGHSLELDDSPNAARVRLGHSEGQFLEMHQNGVTVLKSTKDLWLAAEGNIIIFAKSGNQIIKVEGNAVFSVDGNMVQEVNGNMQQIVRGNYELSVGGQLNLNGSEEIQARAAKVRIESNVEGINLKSAKKINIQSGEAINIKSAMGILQEAVGDFNIKGDNFYTQSAGAIHFKAGDAIFQEAAADINIKGDNLFIQGAGNTNIKSAQVFLDSAGNMNIKAAYTKIGNGQVSIKGTSVAIDEFVFLANGQAVTAPGGTAATAAEEALPAGPAEGAELPEPATKSAGNGSGGGSGIAGGGYGSPSLSGSGGVVSQDDAGGGSGGSQSLGSQVEGNFVAGDYADIEEALKAQGFSEQEITAALAIIGGESNGAFTAVETSYSGTSNERIRSIFNKTRSLTDAELTALKGNDTEFYNFVYGGKLGNGAGNNDGYNYRGRGLIQLTFKSNYERYAKLTGYDIVSNPSLVNTDKKIAATVTAAYLKDRVRRTGDPVADIRAAVAGTRTGRAYTMNIDKDRTRYARLLSERGIS